jgi:hypothetical protein
MDDERYPVRPMANYMGPISGRAPLQCRPDLRQIFDELAAGPLCPRSGRPDDEQAPAGESDAMAKARTLRNARRYALWAALTAADKTQIVAWMTFAKDFAAGVPRFRVSLPEHPEVELAAHDELHAVPLYNQLCGILSVTPPDELGRGSRHSVSRIPLEGAGA